MSEDRSYRDEDVMSHRPFSYCLILMIATVSTITMGVQQTTGADQATSDTRPDRTKLSECLADVKEVADWSPAAARSSAITLCKLRRQHATQQKRFTSALIKLHALYKGQTNHGFAQHLPTAQQDAQAIVKSCIDFKTGFTYPHNIGTLTVPEEIHAKCYGLGIELVESELSR